MSLWNVRENKVPSPNAQRAPRSAVNAHQPSKRRTMMFNVKQVFLTTALVVSGALVAPLVAMATGGGVLGSAFLTPAGNTGCTMNSILGKYLTITPDDGGGQWPIPFPNSTLGTSYEFRYTVTTNVPSAVSNIKVALNAKLPTPVTSNGTTEISNFEPACKGSLGHLFAVNVCDARVAPLLTNESGKVSVFMHDISSHAPAGGAAAVGYLFIAGCSPLEVPIDAPPAFANVLGEEKIEANGVLYCIPLGPDQCPRKGTGPGTQPYLCSDQTKAPLQEVILSISDNVGGGTHIFQWAQGTKDNPVCPRGTLNGNPGTCYITSGGRTYKIC